MFKIKNHILVKENDETVEFLQSPNHGRKINPLYIILHYTGSLSFTSPLHWLRDPESRVSAHLLVGKDGRVVQMVPFNIAAWHAGKSQWNGLIGLNAYSIGIEMVNMPDMPYTKEQIVVVEEICKAIIKEYDIQDILGHEDVAPGRKFDPGKEWKMDEFKNSIGFEVFLKRGNKGEKVKELQKELKRLDLYPGKIDGDFGPMTEKAVKLYQKSKGLETSGKIRLSDIVQLKI